MPSENTISSHPANMRLKVRALVSPGKIAQFPHIANVCPSDEPLPAVPGIVGSLYKVFATKLQSITFLPILRGLFCIECEHALSANGQYSGRHSHKQLTASIMRLWNKNGIFMLLNRRHALDLLEDRVQESEKE